MFEDATAARFGMRWLAPQPAHLEPIWLRRSISPKDRSDGGWAGRYQMPEWPTWFQLSALRHNRKKRLTGQANTVRRACFRLSRHRTGLLLMALSLNDKAAVLFRRINAILPTSVVKPKYASSAVRVGSTAHVVHSAGEGLLSPGSPAGGPSPVFGGLRTITSNIKAFETRRSVSTG